jgi:predicted acylesterase/phospholipase RssA
MSHNSNQKLEVAVSSQIPSGILQHAGAQRGLAELGVRMDSGGVSAGSVAASFSAGRMPGVEVVMLGDFLDGAAPAMPDLTGKRLVVLPDIHVADVCSVRRWLDQAATSENRSRRERRQNRSRRNKK